MGTKFNIKGMNWGIATLFAVAVAQAMQNWTVGIAIGIVIGVTSGIFTGSTPAITDSNPTSVAESPEAK